MALFVVFPRSKTFFFMDGQPHTLPILASYYLPLLEKLPDRTLVAACFDIPCCACACPLAARGRLLLCSGCNVCSRHPLAASANLQPNMVCSYDRFCRWQGVYEKRHDRVAVAGLIG